MKDIDRRLEKRGKERRKKKCCLKRNRVGDTVKWDRDGRTWRETEKIG